MEEIYLNDQDDVQLPAKPARTETVTLDSFVMLTVIGKGSYAKVTLVRKKDSGEVFAMKILKKEHIQKKK